MPITRPELEARPCPEATSEINIGPEAANIVDFWRPDGDGPYPVVLMIHGGCWQKEIADRKLMSYAADAFHQEGFAVWNIEYRGVDEKGGGYPGTFLDVALAADALLEHAERLNLQRNNITAFGHSAGGHLALWLAARKNISTTSPLWQADPLGIKRVISTGGLADLEFAAPITKETCLKAILYDLVGDISDTRPNVFSDTSPAELLPIGVEQISINSDLDHISPPLLGEAYTKKATAAGDDAHLHFVEGASHMDLIAPGSAAFDQTIDILKSDLRRN